MYKSENSIESSLGKFKIIPNETYWKEKTKFCKDAIARKYYIILP